MDDSEAIKRLPGDLKEVAELIGLEHTLLLIDRYGGTYINIPKCDALIQQIRNKKIRELYDSGKYDVRQLAWRFRLTDRQIKRILSEAEEGEIPLPLFDLVKDL